MLSKKIVVVIVEEVLLIFVQSLYQQFNDHSVPARWDHQQVQEEEVWVEHFLALL